MRFRIVDAFTDRPFSGNPAAVFVLKTDDWPDARWMQTIALEMSVSESAFAYKLPAGSEADYALRWFTPLVEDELCGHATLAVAHALHGDRGTAATVTFQTRSGILAAASADGGKITLDFPRPELASIDPPDGLTDALGQSPDHTLSTGTLGDVLAVYSDESTVRNLQPDHGALAQIQSRTSRLDRGIIVTAQAENPAADYDFVSRFFTPCTGVPEDPVTGSAHTALAPYWSERLTQERLQGLQVSRRSGRIDTTVTTERVYLSGTAVTVAEGTLLHLPKK